ncbi:MAG: hypothetical protein AB1644_07380 [Candidatus Zixiibacteriota bacterium]
MRILVFTTVLLSAGVSLALVQPDISAIGDFRAFTGNWTDSLGSKSPRNGNLNMKFDELEVVIAGYLNPYAKGWITVSSPGDGFEIEEAYATVFQGLPLKSEFRAGQWLIDFGKLNISHTHAYPFIDRPLVHRVFLGGDGWKDQGINLNMVLPTPFYSKLSLSALKGKIFESEEPPEDPLDGRYTETPVFTGRFSIFTPVGQKGNMDIGVSGMFGRYKGQGANGTGDSTSGFRNLYAKMAAVDAKYKIRWNDYTNLTLQGEAIFNKRDLFTDQFETRSNWGAFAYADLRFRKRYNIGVAFDRVPGIYDNGEDDYEQNIPASRFNTELAAFDEKNASTAITIFTGFSLLEETTLFRLAGRWVSYSINDSKLLVDPSETSKKSEFTLIAQMLFSLGPHKPHDF